MRIVFSICLVIGISPAASGQDTATLLRALQHADRNIRAQAAEYLVESGDEAKVSKLLDVIRRGPETAAARAAFVLTRIKHAAGTDWSQLTETLSDQHAEAWRWSLAAHLWLRLSETPANDEVAGAATRALEVCNQPMKRYAAVKLVYHMGREGMGRHSDSAARQLVDMLGSFRGDYSEVPIGLSTITSRNASRVVHIAASSDPRNREASLRHFTTDQFIIAAARRTADPTDRSVAAGLLCHLRQLSRLGSPTVKLEAARQLADLDTPAPAITTLLELLEPWQDEDIREAAADQLGSLGEAAFAAIPRLARLLASEAPPLRQAGANAIGKIAGAIRNRTARQADYLSAGKHLLDQAIEVEALLPIVTSRRSSQLGEPIDVPGALQRARALVQKALAG